MTTTVLEAKKLTFQLTTNEDKYVTGQLDLYETLHETDAIYEQVLEEEFADKTATANKIVHDSNLMKLQSRYAKQRSKYFKPDSLVFNAAEFSTKLKLYYGQSSSSLNGSDSSKVDELLWLKVGEFAKKILNTVPSFNFIHGTFDPDPVEIVKKKRKMREKDKVGKETKPQSVNLNETLDNQDALILEAQRVLSVLWNLCGKSEDKLICYFEFVTDPTSFTRTVENVFLVSLLVKEGCVRLIKDGKGLPCLTIVDEKEKQTRNPMAERQCIISMSLKEWQDIIKTFKFKKPLFPPRKPIRRNDEDL